MNFKLKIPRPRKRRNVKSEETHFLFLIKMIRSQVVEHTLPFFPRSLPPIHSSLADELVAFKVFRSILQF